MIVCQVLGHFLTTMMTKQELIDKYTILTYLFDSIEYFAAVRTLVLKIHRSTVYRPQNARPDQTPGTVTNQAY